MAYLDHPKRIRWKGTVFFLSQFRIFLSLVPFTGYRCHRDPSLRSGLWEKSPHPRVSAVNRCLIESEKMSADRKIRVLVAKPGLDGHDRGAKVIARALRDAGMEVIYTGLRQTPEMIVNSALQEDVDVIGLSILSGAHNAIVPRVSELLRQNKMEDVLFLIGGIIPEQDFDFLKKAGVNAIFNPGTPMDDIADFIRKNVKPRSIPV